MANWQSEEPHDDHSKLESLKRLEPNWPIFISEDDLCPKKNKFPMFVIQIAV